MIIPTSTRHCKVGDNGDSPFNIWSDLTLSSLYQCVLYHFLTLFPRLPIILICPARGMCDNNKKYFQLILSFSHALFLKTVVHFTTTVYVLRSIVRTIQLLLVREPKKTSSEIKQPHAAESEWPLSQEFTGSPAAHNI